MHTSYSVLSGLLSDVEVLKSVAVEKADPTKSDMSGQPADIGHLIRASGALASEMSQESPGVE